MFLRERCERELTLEEPDNEQSKLVNELNGIDRRVKPAEKISSLKNVGLFLGARKNVHNDFKSRIFPIKNLDKITTPDPAPESAPELAP